MSTIHTVTGPCQASDLGITLMHEHLLIGWPGWESDTAAPAWDRGEAKRMCVDRMQELKGLGVTALVDPCPIDLGRDVEFAAEVSQASGVRVICATGLYKEESGAAPFYKFRGAFTDTVAEMTETFVREVTEGIGRTGIKAGVIKVATGPHQVTDYEKAVLTAAARAHRATGAPITTHTDEGTMGREQLAILTGAATSIGAVTTTAVGAVAGGGPPPGWAARGCARPGRTPACTDRDLPDRRCHPARGAGRIRWSTEASRALSHRWGRPPPQTWSSSP
jgi:predicted metal-dependent phosphotriesterase family hydrolase